MRSATPLLIIVGLLAVQPACGGGVSEPAAAKDASASCLDDAGAEVETRESELDYIAEDAGEGAFRVVLGEREATVVFERTEKDARRTEQAYELFTKALGGPSDDILERRGTVVISWDKTPTADDQEIVRGCLVADTAAGAAKQDEVRPKVLSMRARAVLAAVPFEVFYEFSPEGKAAFGELEEISRDGIDQDEEERVPALLDRIDAELEAAEG